MNLRNSFWDRGSIATRLLLRFLAFSLLPCLVLTGLTTYRSRLALELAVRERLTLIANAKITQLENFIRERRGDAYVVGNNPEIADTVIELAQLIQKEKTDSPAYRRVADRAHGILTQFAEFYGYANLFLFDLEANLLLEQRPEFEPGMNLLTGPYRDTEFAEVFERSKAVLGSSISNFQMYPGRKEPMAFFAIPIKKAGVVVGVVIFQFGNDEVFRVFNDYAGLGATGEVLVGARTGDEVTFVAPTRFDSLAAFHRRVPPEDPKSAALRRAVQGDHGYGESIDYRGKQTVAVWSYLPSLRWGIVAKQDADEAFELIYHQRLVTAALLAATGAVVVPVAVVLARSLTRPIREAATVAQAVANGDLSAQIAMTAKGEAGQLLVAVQQMTEHLRTLIGRVQKSSVALMSTATEIAATSRQQERTVMEYGSSTNEAAAAVKEISATGQELLRTMNELNEVAGHTGTMASEGQTSLAGMDRTMHLLADSTGSISAKLSVISERAANINLVVTTITKVADQTNLLSINAAIEAEKAGEYGLGFLVVAREIRRLADQTAVATLDIERMVKEMQSSVASGVMEMDKFSDQVRQGVVEVGHIGEQLNQIIAAVHLLDERFDLVTEGMRVQATGADQIREAVVRINDGANQTSTSLREFNKATDYLRDAVSELKEEVSRFMLGGPALPS